MQLEIEMEDTLLDLKSMHEMHFDKKKTKIKIDGVCE